MPIPLDETDNGVPYDWGLSGPDGAWFALKPIRGIHTPDDAEQAEWELRRQRDVLSFRCDWQPRPSVQVGGLRVEQLQTYLQLLEPLLAEALAAEDAIPEWELEETARQHKQTQDGRPRCTECDYDRIDVELVAGVAGISDPICCEVFLNFLDQEEK